MGPAAPFATITVLHAPTLTSLTDALGGASKAPDSPVFAAQVICQFAVAVTGHVPRPPVRSGVERTLNMYAHMPGAGSLVISTSGPGSAPMPSHVTGAAGLDRFSGETGSPIDQITDVILAVAVTETGPAVTVADTGPGSSTHM